ncbi:hypothetical protein CgunFtcFv8_008462 [Champsocephalus gunnari]|uniref:Uncharacterized protein n=1 Tax=Champsocephalus gunnari TaxID=52237 RepID=A0AAN8HIX9_CHAGU|nr:hypothetical protein CgunFtcFv8_008462 [Champsocephalus gunnari]
MYEDDSTFLRLWHVEQYDDPDTEDIAVGLLMISARSTDTTLFCPERIAVVIEDNSMRLWGQAICCCLIIPEMRGTQTLKTGLKTALRTAAVFGFNNGPLQ